MLPVGKNPEEPLVGTTAQPKQDKIMLKLTLRVGGLVRIGKQHTFFFIFSPINKQVAQWATIAHHGASIIFGDTIIYNAQRQITLNLKQ